MRILHAATTAALCVVTVASAISPVAAETTGAETSAVLSQPTRDVTITGPGLYIPATRTFRFAERDAFTGVFDREYRLTAEPQKPRRDLSVFGPGWRADILGGLTSRQLDSYESHAQVTDLHEGETVRYDLVAADGRKTYKASTGSTLTVVPGRATETIILDADTTLTLTWEQVGGHWRVAAISGSPDASTVTYDGEGRVAAITDGAGTTLTLSYAKVTTAAADRLGDVAGQLKSVESQGKDDAARVLETYRYDRQGYLRDVTLLKGGRSATAAYAYDGAGRLAQIKSPGDGTWSLKFSNSPEPAATLVEAETPGAGVHNYPSTCPNASQWLWLTRSECRAASVAHYGWRSSGNKTTPTGHRVIGISNDHCSSPTGSNPGGYNFTAACDMHDYGFGVIGNYYKGATYHMTPSKKNAVDEVFYTTLLDRTCAAYGSPFGCMAWAWTYRQGVRLGDPKNGADAT